MKREKSEAEILLQDHLDEQVHTWHKAEWKFHPKRRWRFDWAIIGAKPSMKIGVEIEGGAWTQGRHTRGAGFVKDMEKYNHAALLGWRVLRFTPQDVLNGKAIAFIRRVLDS